MISFVVEILEALSLTKQGSKDASSVTVKVKKWVAARHASKRRQLLARFASQEQVAKVVNGIYGPIIKSGKSEFAKQVVTTPTGSIDTGIYFCETGGPGCPDLRAIEEEILPGSHSRIIEDTSASLVKRYGEKVRKYMLAAEQTFWDAPAYTLAQMDLDGSVRLGYRQTKYFDFRFKTQLVEDELQDALIKVKGEADEVLRRATELLPIRSGLLPNATSVGNLEGYENGCGVLALFAIARPAPYSDYVILVQKRSRAVGSGHDLYSLMPQGFHQPGSKDTIEHKLYITLLREVYEEVFRGEEVREPSNHVAWSWFLGNCPGVKWIVDHGDAVRMELLGLMLGPSAGYVTFPVLLVIEDVTYWEVFGGLIMEMWEMKGLECLSSDNTVRIGEILAEEWTGIGICLLLKGLDRLSDLYPNHFKSVEEFELTRGGRE